jgi:hypothetical protein
MEDEYDLRGFRLQIDLDFPTDDNFIAIDFSHAWFLHSRLKNALFASVGFRFTDFSKTTFQNCTFLHAYFFSSSFDQVQFENCSFHEETVFLNCAFNNVTFNNCFFDERARILSCRFDHQVNFTKFPRASLFRNNQSRPLKADADLYSSIATGYENGSVFDSSEIFFYLARQSSTRHNTSKLSKLPVLYLEEFLTGYGTKPHRILVSLALIYVLFTLYFYFAGPVENFGDSMVFTAGALFTFGAFADHLNQASLLERLGYVTLSFIGISGLGLFIATLTSRWLRASRK